MSARSFPSTRIPTNKLPARSENKPICALHPDGFVRRHGYYGKQKQYVKWECIFEGQVHMLRHELTLKLVGGGDGCCEECERQWGATEGMPQGDRDRFTLREKAAALVRLSEGMSYREAGEHARRRSSHAGHGTRVSRDGRLARDWVSQYTPILADHYLPRKWPRNAVLLDALPIHVRDFATQKQSGKISFYVLAASAPTGENKSDLIRTTVTKKADEHAWASFLRELPGEPMFVVADRNSAMLNGITAAWPNTKWYPCAYHLMRNVEEMMKIGGLHRTKHEAWKTLNRRSFIDPLQYALLLRVVERCELAARTKRSTTKESIALTRVQNWLVATQPEVARCLAERHWPVSAGAVEESLRTIKGVLSYRRANLHNLDRVADLVTLNHLNQLGVADERKWAIVLRDRHAQTNGAPPVRRVVDDPALRTR